MTIGIYCIEHIDSGKKYIGKSKNIEKRWNSHKTNLRKTEPCKSVNRYLWLAVQKYGLFRFEFKILEEFNALNESLLTKRELYWIDFYNVLDKGFGYNLARHTESSVVFSDETRKLMSERRKGLYEGENNQNYGKKASEETRAKLSKVHKGKKLTEQHKEKISETLRVKNGGPKLKPQPKTKVPHHHSEETKAKIGVAHLGRKLTQESKDKIGKANSGRIVSTETRNKLSKLHKGRKFKKEVIDKRIATRKRKRSPDGYLYIQMSETLEIIKEWLFVWDLVDLGFIKFDIIRACEGIVKTHKGFCWARYKTEGIDD